MKVFTGLDLIRASDYTAKIKYVINDYFKFIKLVKMEKYDRYAHLFYEGEFNNSPLNIKVRVYNAKTYLSEWEINYKGQTRYINEEVIRPNKNVHFQNLLVWLNTCDKLDSDEIKDHKIKMTVYDFLKSKEGKSWIKKLNDNKINVYLSDTEADAFDKKVKGLYENFTDKILIDESDWNESLYYIKSINHFGKAENFKVNGWITINEENFKPEIKVEFDGIFLYDDEKYYRYDEKYRNNCVNRFNGSFYNPEGFINFCNIIKEKSIELNNALAKKYNIDIEGLTFDTYGPTNFDVSDKLNNIKKTWLDYYLKEIPKEEKEFLEAEGFQPEIIIDDYSLKANKPGYEYADVTVQFKKPITILTRNGNKAKKNNRHLIYNFQFHWHDKYQIFIAPVMFRNFNGLYKTFDSAKENCTDNILDIVFKKNYFTKRTHWDDFNLKENYKNFINDLTKYYEFANIKEK